MYLRAFLACASRCPWLIRWTRGFWVWAAWCTVPALRKGTLANARRILGSAATRGACARLGRAVFSNFYCSIAEMAGLLQAPDDILQSRIERIDGTSHYLEARGHRQGLILLTAHLGAFETGMSMVMPRESRVCVLFRRDPLPPFEAIRSAWRRRLGVVEVSVEEGLSAWTRLRDVLSENGVVVMQGDRVLPGQKGVRVPFFDGHVSLPAGPVKLSRLTGAPIVPVFAVRLPGGRIRILLEESMTVGPDPEEPGRVPEALRRFASLLECRIREYPDQWLTLQEAWVEDQSFASNPVLPVRPENS